MRGLFTAARQRGVTPRLALTLMIMRMLDYRVVRLRNTGTHYNNVANSDYEMFRIVYIPHTTADVYLYISRLFM